MAYLWCDSTDSLRDWADGLAPDQPLYLDTEFMRERTYYPRLALVQVHDGEHIRLIDTTRALARQEEVKRLKRLRLRLKDRIAALSQPDRTTAKG